MLMTKVLYFISVGRLASIVNHSRNKFLDL